MSSSDDSHPFLNFLIGLVIGVGGTFLYIRFGIELPSAAGIGQKITNEAIVKTAEFELFNTSNPPLVRRRALASLLAYKPEMFLQVDAAINNRFMAEFLRQHQPTLRNGPVVMNPPKAGSPLLIGASSPQSEIEGGTKLTFSPALISNSISRSWLQSKYPSASDEVIDFLLEHPELRVSSLPIGQPAKLPGVLRIGTKSDRDSTSR